MNRPELLPGRRVVLRPATPEDERPVYEDMSLTSCIVQGQQIASEWVSDHPKWMLTRWRCEQNVPRNVPS